MANPIQQTMTDDGPSIYYSEAFRKEIEANIFILKNAAEAYVVTVEPNIAFKYEFDFYGLLLNYKVPKYYHYACLIANNLSSPCDYRKEKKVIQIPDLNAIERLKTTFTTTHSSI